MLSTENNTGSTMTRHRKIRKIQPITKMTSVDHQNPQSGTNEAAVTLCCHQSKTTAAAISAVWMVEWSQWTWLRIEGSIRVKNEVVGSVMSATQNCSSTHRENTNLFSKMRSKLKRAVWQKPRTADWLVDFVLMLHSKFHQLYSDGDGDDGGRET